MQCRSLTVLIVCLTITLAAVFVLANKDPPLSDVTTQQISPSCAIDGAGTVRNRLGSKTDYNEAGRELSLQHGLAQAAAEGCVPVQLQVLGRHGARYPTTKDWNKKLGPLLRKLQAQYPLPLAEGWTGYTADQLENLTPRGRSQLRSLGTRVSAALPMLFSSGWDAGKHKLESSWKPRSRDSAAEFATGAFPAEQAAPAPFQRETTEQGLDHMLRPFADCAAHTANSEGDAKKEPKLWKGGERMRAVLRQVREELGAEWLTMGDVLTLYKGCGYLLLSEQQWARGSTAPAVLPGLCAAFRNSDLTALEFYFDLKKNAEFGYGTNVSTQLARPLLQLISTEWRLGAAHAASMRFGHAESTLPMLAALGLYNDSTPLTADSSDEQIAERAWNVSEIAPMAANLMLVLHQCGGALKFQLYVNEQLTESIPAVCPTTETAGLCHADAFHRKFGDYTDSQFDRVCHNSEH